MKKLSPVLQHFEWQKGVSGFLGTPPGSPSKGDAYIIADGTGDWSGKDGQIARWMGTEWEYTVPFDGMFVRLADDGRLYEYKDTAWGQYLGFGVKFGNPNPASIEDTGYVGIYNVPGTNIPYVSANFYDDEAMEVVNLPVPFETGFLIGDFSAVPDLYASFEVISLDESSVVRAFIPIVPELYAGTYDYVFQNLHTALQIRESLIDTTYYPIVSGFDSSDTPGLLFGDTIYIYDQNDDNAMTLAFVSNDLESVNAFQVNADTGRLTYLSLSDSGLGSLGFDVLGDISAAKPIIAGSGVNTVLSISAKPFLAACNVGDGVRMRFRSGRQGGIFGTTVDTAYFESVMEDVGATTWESSFQGYVNNVSGSMQWLNVDADGTTIFPQVVRMVTGTNTNIETDEITIDLSGLEEGLAISAPILKPTAYSTLPEALPFPYAIGTYDRLAIITQGDFDEPEIIFTNPDFSSSGSIGANLTDGYLWANWDWCPQEPDEYSIGSADLPWVNGYFSGTVYAGGGQYDFSGSEISIEEIDHPYYGVKVPFILATDEAGFPALGLSSYCVRQELEEEYWVAEWWFSYDGTETYRVALNTTNDRVDFYTTSYPFFFNNIVDATGFKCGGTSAVADGTYTVGKGSSQDGTITVKGGIITAVQQASN